MSGTYKKASAAFVGASWLSLIIGVVLFSAGLWALPVAIAIKGFFITLLFYGLFSCISVQKAVRDRLDNIQVTNLYYGISWLSVILCLFLMTIGLFNLSLSLDSKGFFAATYVLSMFAAIAVQKNTRDNLGMTIEHVI